MKRPPARHRREGRSVELEAFEHLWPALFRSPAHLDALLARTSAAVRPALATAVPAILRAPTALARALGVRLSPGEPWSLDAEALARWAPARAMVELCLARPPPSVRATLEDYPPHMAAEWSADLGTEAASALAELLGSAPPVTLRAARVAGRERVRALVASELGVDCKPCLFAPLGLELARFAPVSRLRREGAELEIQDEGSQVLSLFALEPEAYAPFFSSAPRAPAPPPRVPRLPRVAARVVVDACAGAGGKTLAMADALGNRGRLFAYDVSARRLEELRRRARRAGLTSVKTVEVGDGRELEVVERFAASADVVLVDAPCSGWGVLRRNPDLKWRQEPEALPRLEALEERLLEAYSGLVAPGGRLVYSTCTFRARETTGLVERFLARHPELEREAGGFLGPGPMDGFFAVALRRDQTKATSHAAQ